MSCFPCFKRNGDDNTTDNNAQAPIAQPNDFTPPPGKDASQVNNNNNNNNNNHNVTNSSFDTNINAPKNDNQSVKAYSFRELATATKNFRQECLLGEGGFGKVFKGSVSTTGQIVAVRQLDRNGVQASNEFVNEVLSLSFLKHPNLVKIIGYCADGEQRILVYEYMPSGSLRNHLFELPAGKKPLDWTARMKIALGIAEGLEFLHEKAKTPIIYRDLKSSNILLDEVNDPKLSEYGLAKLVQASSNKTHVAPSVMAGYGYGAPEYERQGEISLKSDVYSFGVVLLELITGRQALDTSLPTEEQKLVSWAQTFFRDPSIFPDMADPLLRNQFPVTSLNQAIGVAAMCLQEESIARPLISDISAALSFLAMAPPEAPIPARLVPILSSRVETCKFSSFTEANNFSDLTQGNSTTNDNNSDSESKDEDQECRMRPRNHKRGEHKHDVKSDSESEDEEQDFQMHHIRDKHNVKSEREAQYKHRKTHHIEAKHDEKSSSDYEYGNSNSDSSDDELVTKSKRLGLSSKCKRKKNSLPKNCRWLRSKSSSLSSSSRDYSISFNLRCNSASMDKNDSSTSRHDVVEHIDSYGHYNNDSSGEESYAGSRNSDRDGHKVKSESEENY